MESGWPRGRVPLARTVIGYRGVEAGVTNESTGDFVIVHVVNGRCREDDVGGSFPQEFGHAASAVVVENDGQIAEFETGVIGFKNFCGCCGFCSANSGDVFGRVFSAATVSGSHGGDGDAATEAFQLQQCAGALEFDIVRVCMDGEHVRLGGECSV